nr:DUF885 family protein [Erythrobacter sp. YT30]
MRPIAFALAFAAAAISTPAWADAQSDYEELREEIWQSTLDNAPLLATSIGDRRGDGKLFDFSLEAYDRLAIESEGYLARLYQINENELPQDLQVDYAILRRSLQDELSGAQYDHTRYQVFTNRGGWFTNLVSLPNRSPFFHQD